MDFRKVYGGTPVGNQSRCDTCLNATIVKGFGESEKITTCDLTYPSMRVPFPVCECSGYTNRTLPSFADMKEIAWYIRDKHAGRDAGFLTQNEIEVKKTVATEKTTKNNVPRAL